MDMSSSRVDIHKAGGVLIQNRKILVGRTRGKSSFIAPGGSIEDGETPQESLIRELVEEFDIHVSESNLELIDTFYADAAEQPDKKIRMDVFLVRSWNGDPKPSSEVEEMRWIDTTDIGTLTVGSIVEHNILPLLKSRGLIE